MWDRNLGWAPLDDSFVPHGIGGGYWWYSGGGWAGLMCPRSLHSMSASLEERTRRLGSARTGEPRHNLCSMAGSKYLNRKKKPPIKAWGWKQCHFCPILLVIAVTMLRFKCRGQTLLLKEGSVKEFSLSLPLKMAVEINTIFHSLMASSDIKDGWICSYCFLPLSNLQSERVFKG